MPIDGVLVLGDLASATWHKPWVVPWSNGRSEPPFGWERTVQAAVRQEVGADPGGSRATAQWARRALPLTVGEQGEVNREGLPGVLLQISGERGPAAGARVSRERFTEVGRGALRAVLAVDEAGGRGAGGDLRPAFAGESAGIVTMRNLLPDWSVRLMVLCLLLPALLAALDAYFRTRRHRLRAGAWVSWALAAGVAVPLAWIWLRLLGITGALPAPRGPVLPSSLPLPPGRPPRSRRSCSRWSPACWPRGCSGARAAPRAATRPRARRRRGRRDRVRRRAARLDPEPVRRRAPGARRAPVAVPRGAADADARGLGLGRARRRAAPAGVRPAGRDGRAAARAARARAGVARGHGGRARVGLAALAAGALAGATATLVRILLARRKLAVSAPPDDERPRTRGPASYAGPGSLGGTESALRR